ncbi:MAG: hypothetical protein BMS9Abin02_0375 [Anaerolineae bacterium]|nr:MAG: hypothetical protein BMS9Abin02_0375 [Anaerolineae bacterium]
MNVLFIASIIITITLILGIIIAAIAGWFGNLIVREGSSAAKEKGRYNAALTMGLEIPVDSDPAEQMEVARKLAAKKAASLPRWGNMRIGQMGKSNQLTAYDGVKEDPVSAVKIASFHGWEGLKSGIVIGEPTPSKAVRVSAQTTVPAKSVSDLVPGVDYSFIEITDEMSPAEKRKARIANSKARSAAIKALKESGAAAPIAPGVETTAEPAKKEAAPVSPETAVTATVAVGKPVAGVDYPFIEITDDMEPSEKRNARIANSKARSAAMKAFKEAGGSTVPAGAVDPSPGQGEDPVQQITESVDRTADEGGAALTADIPKPEYIEITDDMDPAEKRDARIHNSKAKSMYNKALKSAGIDPSTLSD